MRILSIETSCDDTAIALVSINLRSPGYLKLDIMVEQNLVSSQTEIHRHWGGVVPNLAKREHLKTLPLLWAEMQERLKLDDRGSRHENIDHPTSIIPRRSSHVDFIAVTVGPGLEPALWTGIEFAKKLSEELKVPLVGANHLEGHLYSFLLPQKTVESVVSCQLSNVFPAIVLIVSGGHTEILLMQDLYHWKKLGETQDDAVGEAFDKVARMLKLPYPGGPEIEKLAQKGNPKAIPFPRPMLHSKDYNFSFSGLKTSVLYYLRDNAPKPNSLEPIPYKLAADVAASFQSAAIEALAKKIERAVEEFGAGSIMLGGGVAANTALRNALQTIADKNQIQFVAPPMEYATDNAAMIAVAAYMRKLRRRKSFPLEADSTLDL